MEKLKDKSEEIEYISQDIKYSYKNKNNDLEVREEKIIVVGVKNNLILMKNKSYVNIL